MPIHRRAGRLPSMHGHQHHSAGIDLLGEQSPVAPESSQLGPLLRVVSSSVAQGMLPSRKACLHVLALYAMWSRAFALLPNFFVHTRQESSTVARLNVSGAQHAHKLLRIRPQHPVARVPRTFGFLRFGASDVELTHCFQPFSLVLEKFHPWLRMMIRIGHFPQGRGGLAHPSQVFKEHFSGSFRCST